MYVVPIGPNAATEDLFGIHVELPTQNQQAYDLIIPRPKNASQNYFINKYIYINLFLKVVFMYRNSTKGLQK